MARKLTYNINRFDQGMSGDIRDTSNPLKFAWIQHLDIYRKATEAHVMPGYVADQTFDGNATGLKLYDVRAINYYDGRVVAVGTKLDGTGSKLFHKTAPTDASWEDGIFGTSVEGTDNLAPHTWLVGGATNLFFITTAGTVTYASRYNGTSISDKVATLISVAPTDISKNLIIERSLLDPSIQYVNTGGLNNNIGSVSGATFTVSARTAGDVADDVQSGDDIIGIASSLNFPSRAQLLLWDSASLLIEQKVNLGQGRVYALGYPHSTWVAVVNEGLDTRVSGLNEQANNDASFSIKVPSGGTAETIYRTTASTNTGGEIIPLRGRLRDAMTFYARVPKDSTPTAYYEGVWAVGKASATSPLAISIPFDTSSLGEIESICNIGNHFYFIHGGDYSVSRLDTFETGAYDVPATIETLFYGSDSPYLKELNGISVTTENLPSGASVQLQYRTDQDNAWTTLGTSNTTGTQRHSFTRAAGTPIGRFQEIQFRIVFTGKIVVKNIHIQITETDSLSY